MGQPFVGEIRMFGGNFAPAGWAFCNGALLPISENETLFNLIGTTYGGDGQSTFAVPDLQGRLPMHQGNGHIIGEKAGTESVTLNSNQIAIHSHPVQFSQANTNSPANNAFGANGVSVYKAGPPSAQMAAGMVANGGGSQPHENMMPFLVVSFIISLFGIFPSQN